MKGDRFLPTTSLIILVLAAALLAGCISPSSEIVPPETRLTMAGSLKAGDCFFRVNDSAHSATTGSSQQITVTGYISNICSQPMESLVVRGTFYDRSGKAFASAEGYAGHVGFHDRVPFNLSVDTGYSDLFTYKLQPVIREQQALF